MKVRDLLMTEAKNLPSDISKRSDAEQLQISIRFRDGHIHHIMPPDEVAKILTEDAASHITLPLNIGSSQEVTKKEPPPQIVFHNRQAIGDILTMTCAIRDFKNAFPNTRVGVITTASHLWDHNPHIDHSFRDEQYVLKIGPGFLTNKSNYWNLHMCNAFRLDIEQKLNISFPQGPIRPDIWMTEEEIKRPPLVDGPYWIFVYGGEPGWTAKKYHRWQEVIDILKGKVQFVQIGVKNHPYPVLDGVINFVGRTEDRNTGIRDLFNLFYHAQGSLGLVSMHMHLSAAFNNPCVVVAGAREPAWFTQYFGHQYIQTNGTMFCSESTACWKCDVKACKNLVGEDLPKCVEIIEPEEIAEAVLKYYKGGRLEFGKKIPNKFFKNIVKQSKTFVSIPTQISLPISEQQVLTRSELTFGGGSLTDKDWAFIKRIIEEYKVDEVLEFGSGLSTLLMETLPIVSKIYSFETHEGWIRKISKLSNGKAQIIQWNGVDVVFPETCVNACKDKRFKLAFVDGPSGGATREWSTKYASEHADLIIIHDAGRDTERQWQNKYLVGSFRLISKGGHRCHLWKKEELCTNKDEAIPFFLKPKPVLDIAKKPDQDVLRFDPILVENTKIEHIDGKEIALMMTTCRGFGGSERSTINIMKMLQDRGYAVLLAPTGHICSAYGTSIPQGVKVINWPAIVNFKPSIAILYCSDTIWNYNQEQYVQIMPHLDAKRKVMVVNFKLGGVGQINWTKGWDKYLFLNNQHRAELLMRIPNAVTKAMAPPTDLSIYFQNEPNYDLPLKLIRHNSQGDSKHHPDTNKMIEDVLNLDSTIEFHFMPPKSDCMDHPNVFKYRRNEPPVHEFLSKGNCFWYRLPEGYTEGGPKVIMEAQASGLACIVDNHSGPKDRVTPETGWLCDNWNDYLEAIKEILDKPELLKIKGQAAREWARKEYSQERWIEEILGD